MKGKFIKPTLKKVSKYENKFAKLQEKAAKFAFSSSPNCRRRPQSSPSPTSLSRARRKHLNFWIVCTNLIICQSACRHHQLHQHECLRPCPVLMAGAYEIVVGVSGGPLSPS